MAADLAYAPYGEVYDFANGSAIDWIFTGDLTQLDSEVLFDTPNREYASTNQGRWLSPDPVGSGWPSDTGCLCDRKRGAMQTQQCLFAN